MGRPACTAFYGFLPTITQVMMITDLLFDAFLACKTKARMLVENCVPEATMAMSRSLSGRSSARATLP
jgi:hypothetical protein